MKKIILSLTTLFLISLSLITAKDLSKATEIYNSGATALMSNDKVTALSCFQKALKMGEACGAEGATLVKNCKSTIPGVILSIGKDLLRKKDYTTALTQITEAIAKAKAYGIQDVEKEASDLLPQIEIAKEVEKANTAYKNKDLNGAISGYKKVLSLDPKNSDVALRLGQVYSKAGKFAEAEEYFTLALKNGEEKTAKSQLSKLYLIKANKLTKESKYNEVIDAAKKANSFAQNAKAYYMIGNAYQKLSKAKEAIDAYETYVKLSPKAKNLPAILFTIGALYQQEGNKTQAIAAYKKVVSNPQYGKQAQQMIKTLSK